MNVGLELLVRAECELESLCVAVGASDLSAGQWDIDLYYTTDGTSAGRTAQDERTVNVTPDRSFSQAA